MGRTLSSRRADNPRSRRRGKRNELQPDRLLHLVGTLFTLAGQGGENRSGTETSSGPMRRRRQRLSLVRALLGTLPPALQPETPFEETFWRALRWGGVGLLMGRVLGA